MTQERYKDIITSIMAMDHLVHSFNDEGWVEPWLIQGVPDGMECREDYEDTYPRDNRLKDRYAELTALFCWIIANQTVSIRMPEKGRDFQPTLKFDGSKIII